MTPRWWMLGAAAVLALLLMFAPTATSPSQAQMGPMLGQPLDQLTGDDFDKAFLAQMTMHHAMGVMMARPVVANASHQEVKDLAQGIIDNQTREIAQMRVWAKNWYGMELVDPLAMMGPGQGMPGTGHPGMPGMPGMSRPGPGTGMGTGPGTGMPGHPGMSTGQMGDSSMMDSMSMMASLWTLPPQRLEAVFMSQMIPHHQGALDMANLVPDRAAHQELKDLATSIIGGQSAEIDQMNEWLSSWYGL